MRRYQSSTANNCRKTKRGCEKTKQRIGGGSVLCKRPRMVPPSATSIDAAVRCRFRRLFRLTRSTPCGLKAAPATGRPVVSLPLQESCMRWTKAIGLLASAPAPRSMLLTVIPAFSLLKICFFTVPFEFKQCRRSAKAQFSPCPIRYERLSASARRAPEAGEWSPAAWPRRSPGRCAGAPPR